MKIITSILLMYFFSYSPPSHGEDDYFGKYNGTVQVEWLDEDRKMKLLSDFSFRDPNGLLWEAKKNRVVNGASIPPVLWSLMGSPFSGKYRDASVIHDIACDDKTRTWEVTHLAFYYAMKESGVSNLRSKIMYAAVYHFGPRWPMIEHVLVQEASQKIETIPAQYETVTERVLVEPSRKEWRREHGSKDGLGSMIGGVGTVTGEAKEEMVLIDVPAKYKIEMSRVLVKPKKTRNVSVPAVYKTVKTTPMQKSLKESEFNRLVESLESLKRDEKSLSLLDIREFH